MERATTAALNASLLAVLQDFIIAVRRAMERRQIDAPLMVVRGDGTLMSDEFAARTPVETIHVVTPTPEPAGPRTLVICMGQEPDSLFFYGTGMYVAAVVAIAAGQLGRWGVVEPGGGEHCDPVAGGGEAWIAAGLPVAQHHDDL